MQQAFLVIGSTGEHSSYTEWCVAVYLDEHEAQKHAARASEWYARHEREIPHFVSSGEGGNPFDPKMIVDYTGVEWRVDSVEFRNTAPETP